MATKKPTLDTHSRPCCGECSFYGPITSGGNGCHVEPPFYAGFDTDGRNIVVYGLEIPSTSMVCEKFDKLVKS